MWLLDLAAASAFEVAGKQRLELHDERELLHATQLLLRKVGAEAQVLSQGHCH
jgi:hypothetical protein